MKRVLTLSIALMGFILIGSSCKKGCDLPEGVDSGSIIHTVNDNKVIVYPTSGYMYQISGGKVIHSTHVYADRFEVSFDGGYTREAVNYNLYNIVCNPKVVKCDVQFDRNVIINDITQTVTYTATPNECDKGCDEKRVVENWVLVPKFPTSYLYVTN